MAQPARSGEVTAWPLPMANAPRRAVRFVRSQIEPLPDDRCQALVQVERDGVGLTTATALGGTTQADTLRAVARATADALSEALGAEVRVRGVQLLQAFAQTVVVVSMVATQGERSQALLGICDGTDDLARAAALAVLNATNRFLGLE